jgi:hypothetical protein
MKPIDLFKIELKDAVANKNITPIRSCIDIYPKVTTEINEAKLKITTYEKTNNNTK